MSRKLLSYAVRPAPACAEVKTVSVADCCSATMQHSNTSKAMLDQIIRQSILETSSPDYILCSNVIVYERDSPDNSLPGQR